MIPETLVQETVIPETLLPGPHGGSAAQGIGGPSQPNGGAVRSEAVGDGTMDIDEPHTGPLAVLEGIAKSASKAISPVLDSVLPALGAVLQPSNTAGPSRQPSMNGNDPAAAQSESIQPIDVPARQFTPNPNQVATSFSHSSPFTSSREISRLPSAMPNGSVSIVASDPFPPPRPRTYRTGYIYDKNMMLHCVDNYKPPDEHSMEQTPDAHPEEPMRIKRIFTRLREAGLVGRMKELPFQQVSFEQVMLVHSEDHWAKVEGTQGESASLPVWLYADYTEMSDEIIQQTKHFYEQLSLYVCRETAHCARLSCGGVIQACISVCTGEVRNAFAIVRPPGHHAEPDEHMGFCFYNNVAVAAREVQRLGLAKKVLILDW